MTHFTPSRCNRPIISFNRTGTGGFSNSANNVPSKSVESNCMGNDMAVPARADGARKSRRDELRESQGCRTALAQAYNGEIPFVVNFYAGSPGTLRRCHG